MPTRSRARVCARRRRDQWRGGPQRVVDTPGGGGGRGVACRFARRAPRIWRTTDASRVTARVGVCLGVLLRGVACRPRRRARGLPSRVAAPGGLAPAGLAPGGLAPARLAPAGLGERDVG